MQYVGRTGCMPTTGAKPRSPAATPTCRLTQPPALHGAGLILLHDAEACGAGPGPRPLPGLHSPVTQPVGLLEGEVPGPRQAEHACKHNPVQSDCQPHCKAEVTLQPRGADWTQHHPLIGNERAELLLPRMEEPSSTQPRIPPHQGIPHTDSVGVEVIKAPLKSLGWGDPPPVLTTGLPAPSPHGQGPGTAGGPWAH